MLRSEGWSPGNDLEFSRFEPLKGTTHRAKRQRLQRANDAIHGTRQGVGVVGQLRTAQKRHEKGMLTGRVPHGRYRRNTQVACD